MMKTATPAWENSLLMRAVRREPVERTPVWLMRQAGRYMAEYRAVRDKVGFLELCKNPQLSAEVMLTAVARLGVDAAIIFSDLLPILEPMGLDLEFTRGDGPVIHNPIRNAKDVERLGELESLASLNFVVETVRQTRAGLDERLPVIGFSGAPFTLASYAIEGGASRNYLHVKSLMYRDEGAWRGLMERLARAVAIYLRGQIAAGAQLVQIFDSWVGCLGGDDYRRYVLPYTRMVIDAVSPAAPVINFATGNPALLPLLSEAGGRGNWRADWRDSARRRLGGHRYGPWNPRQSRPVVLLADRATIRRTGEVLDRRWPPGAHLQPRPRHPSPDSRRQRYRAGRSGA